MIKVRLKNVSFSYQNSNLKQCSFAAAAVIVNDRGESLGPLISLLESTTAARKFNQL